jgi:hypothetical protein
MATNHHSQTQSDTFASATNPHGSTTTGIAVTTGNPHGEAATDNNPFPGASNPHIGGGLLILEDGALLDLEDEAFLLLENQGSQFTVAT